MKTEQKIAVIGLGNIGKAVAENLNKSGRKFIVAGRDTAKVQEVSRHRNPYYLFSICRRVFKRTR